MLTKEQDHKQQLPTLEHQPGQSPVWTWTDGSNLINYRPCVRRSYSRSKDVVESSYPTILRNPI